MLILLGKHPHVELCDLLKLEGWSESGAQAKIAIADGLVKVDGAVETRKRSATGHQTAQAVTVTLCPSKLTVWPATILQRLR
ncbi:ribosome-associated protein YbcJ, partial [Enterobacter kobei]|uniref:ribosome-associated protein YbcJ n=1 Tax=Enterobacter kobei TaxID=208224 RepID=UPI003D69D5C8